jgi:uncharacterized protein
MKRLLALLTLSLALGVSTLAQQASPASQPTKEDIERYYKVMNVRQMMKDIMDAMSKQVKQLMREQIAKREPSMKPDEIARVEEHMDTMLKGIDFEEMLQAMTPVYQKHLTKGDLEAIIAFYSSPAGQKILKEMPAMTAEAMQASSGIMRKQMDVVMQKTEEFITAMQKDAKSSEKPN